MRVTYKEIVGYDQGIVMRLLEDLFMLFVLLGRTISGLCIFVGITRVLFQC